MRMDQFRYLILYWRIQLGGLPQLPQAMLRMPAVFIVTWSILSILQIDENIAFVWAAIIAQADRIWSTLSISIAHQRRLMGEGSSFENCSVLGLIIAMLAFQIWQADPDVSQHTLTAIMAFICAGLCFGLLVDKFILDVYAPANKETDIPLSFRRHLLMLIALTIISGIAVYEGLVALDVSLNKRVGVLSILPILLHYFFHITLRLTFPSLDDSTD